MVRRSLGGTRVSAVEHAHDGGRHARGRLRHRNQVALMDDLCLSTKANVARLAIGRSLAQGAFNNDVIDSKGLEIPATSLFSQEDIGVWVGLISAHAKMHGVESIDSMDAFRAAVRKHWHRGVRLLMKDWQAADSVPAVCLGKTHRKRSAPVCGEDRTQTWRAMGRSVSALPPVRPP